MPYRSASGLGRSTGASARCQPCVSACATRVARIRRSACTAARPRQRAAASARATTAAAAASARTVVGVNIATAGRPDAAMPSSDSCTSTNRNVEAKSRPKVGPNGAEDGALARPLAACTTANSSHVTDKIDAKTTAGSYHVK
jgi:hypothetical protein